MLHIRVDETLTGSVLELYDLTGSRVMHEVLTATRSSFSTAALPDGIYLYRLLDHSAAPVRSGKVSVIKN
jgi:hypothetical protein